MRATTGTVLTPDYRRGIATSQVPRRAAKAHLAAAVTAAEAGRGSHPGAGAGVGAGAGAGAGAGRVQVLVQRAAAANNPTRGGTRRLGEAGAGAGAEVAGEVADAAVAEAADRKAAKKLEV
jgi:hypothetical protein